jgi:hypothetical protein
VYRHGFGVATKLQLPSGIRFFTPLLTGGANQFHKERLGKTLPHLATVVRIRAAWIETSRCQSKRKDEFNQQRK